MTAKGNPAAGDGGARKRNQLVERREIKPETATRQADLSDRVVYVLPQRGDPPPRPTECPYCDRSRPFKIEWTIEEGRERWICRRCDLFIDGLDEVPTWAA